MPPRKSVLFGIFAVASFTVCGQNPVEAARQWRIQHQSEILQGFSALLSIPNVTADPVNLRRNADTLVSLLRQRHFASRLLLFPGSPPVVFGERQTPGAKHTIVFYAHYDGQPVTPSEWHGNAPFLPALREVDGEQRIFARSAVDDKAAIYAQLVALDALQAANIALRANIRFVWEGEEEAGSPHLEQILDANRDLVHGDVWLV